MPRHNGHGQFVVMNAPANTHTAGPTWSFVRHLSAQGISQKALLRGTGLTAANLSQEGAKAPLPALVQIFQNGADLTGDDLVGFHWGQTRKTIDYGLIGYVGATSATLRDLLNNVARFSRVFTEPMQIDASDLAKTGKLSWRLMISGNIDTTQFVEGQASQMIFSLPRLIQSDLRPELMRFAHPRTRNQQELEKGFGCPVLFGEPETSITFRKSDLEAPVIRSDPRLHAILIQHAEHILAQTPSHAPDIRIAVERAIAESLSSGNSTVDNIARRLGYSTRTLTRRLGEAGTTFQDVLSEFREALARRYLQQGDMSQAQIAFLLGYSDVSNFSTAFKRWTGQSPNSLRRGA